MGTDNIKHPDPEGMRGTGAIRTCIAMVGATMAVLIGPWGPPPAYAQVPTPTRTPTATSATPGPPPSFFGIVNANGCFLCNDPLCLCSGPSPTPVFDSQGRQIFQRPTGSGFIVVVEGDGPSIATSLPDTCSTSDQPDLQIESSRKLGAGPVAVCPLVPGVTYGIQGFSTPDFGPSTAVTTALQAFGHRFDAFSSLSGGCTVDSTGEGALVNPASDEQFCYLLGKAHEFPPGDTILTAQLRDSNQNVGSRAQIVVRVPSTGFGVSGALRYYANLLPVGGATVQLQGSSPSSTQSDTSGQFAFANLTSTNWTITPQKNGDAGLGVSALDAVYVLQSTVGLRTLTAQQRLACDVTGNGSVTAVDAVAILQLTVGLITRLPVAQTCNSDWVFVPNALVVPNQQLTQPVMSTGSCQKGAIAYQPLTGQADTQDFSAILFGDCTGNWHPAGGAAASVASARTTRGGLRLGRATHRGRHVRVPVYVDGGAALGVNFQLEYDATQLSAPTVHRLPGASNAVLAANDHTPGRLTVALANSAPLGSGPILMLQFDGSQVRGLPPIRVVSSSVTAP